MNNKISGDFRALTKKEIEQLEKAGCFASSWEQITIQPELDLSQIRNVTFKGWVKISKGTSLFNIPGGISNCEIGENVRIENVNRIDFDEEASCGVGCTVAALDETGSRPVVIYPGLSAQIATLMAREPKWFENNLSTDIHDFLDSKKQPQKIDDNSVIIDCGRLKNVSIGKEVTVEGALSLVNGSIINNAPNGKSITKVGVNVDAENFIIEDGCVESGVILRNCYVGQGVEISRGFSAHDSLFFANCMFENGEACALLACPYSVSMHKGTLLIGCQTTFMNAGSSTNQSNHMYKLGPVHWGVLERGVKTSSGAYIMLGAKIGAFSLVMGQHKSHPDSSSFPFSYLFGDEKGATVVVPGAMLRSCGLLRDEKKWPARDRRIKKKLPLNDRIIFNVLNPFTVDAMLKAIDTISELLTHPADDDLFVRHKGMKFTRAALERAKMLYTYAIFKYLSLTLTDGKFPEADGQEPEEWTDVGGQIVPRFILDKALEAGSIPEAEEIFSNAFDNYAEYEKAWIGRRFDSWWKDRQNIIGSEAEEFDKLVETDRNEYLQNLSNEHHMLSL